jgi:AcrR family transcriptional regulator
VISTTSDVGTRERLLDAAAEVFAEKGYEKAGVQEIARRAALTTGAIYSRFSGKAELLAEAIDARTNLELDELFAQHRFDGSAADILTTVGSHLVRRTDLGTSERALLLEAFVASRRDPEVATALRAHIELRAQRLAELVEQAKVDGRIAADFDTDAVVRFCHAVGLGFLLLEAVEVDMPEPGPWEALIERLVGSLAPDPSTTQTTDHTTAQGD